MSLVEMRAALDEMRAARDALVHAVVALPDLGAEDEVRLLAGVARDRALRLRLGEMLAPLGWERSATAWHLEWAPIARARLEAALVGVPDTLLDGRAAPGEWSIRQQLAHVELTDIRYSLATQYGSRRRDDDPLTPPPEIYPPRRGDPSGSPGEPLAAILERMRRVRAEAIAPLLAIPAERLQRSVEWHGADHTVGFRLHRFAQHDLELATDVRATLTALGHRPTRPARVAAVLVESRGEVESSLLGVPDALHAPAPAGGESLAVLLSAHAGEDRRLLVGLQREEERR